MLLVLQSQDLKHGDAFQLISWCTSNAEPESSELATVLKVFSKNIAFILANMHRCSFFHFEQHLFKLKDFEFMLIIRHV